MQNVVATLPEIPDAPAIAPNSGEMLHELITDLYPICRSITGAGTVATLQHLQKIIPLSIYKIATGTRVFDWQIPKEWNISDAFIKNASGEKIIDFKVSNLHVVNYSTPVHTHLPLSELQKHLHSMPEHPEWIPYRTSYYHEDWGFCMSHNQLKSLKDEVYEVRIDSTLEPGNLTYGELVVKGESSDEVLISTTICHPSLCNDNLSGISVATFLAQNLLLKKPRLTYRFLFIPATIGAIAWLAINETQVSRIKHGLVAALLGYPGPFTYKKSRIGNADIDKIVQYVLTQNHHDNKIKEFEPYGYDERQFCSPGFNLPVGSLSRTPYGEFPEYHTSADNLELVKPDILKESLDTYLEIVKVLEENKTYINTKPKGEPQLGKYGLYDKMGGFNNTKEFQMALLWTLNLSDGLHSLLDVSIRSSIKFDTIVQAASRLSKAGLLKEQAK